ncbi:MAG: hypothetical protein ACLU6W_10070 [Lachnospiraceae bacterium]
MALAALWVLPVARLWIFAKIQENLNQKAMDVKIPADGTQSVLKRSVT